jgi:hypothetical protein
MSCDMHHEPLFHFGSRPSTPSGPLNSTLNRSIFPLIQPPASIEETPSVPLLPAPPPAGAAAAPGSVAHLHASPPCPALSSVNLQRNLEAVRKQVLEVIQDVSATALRCAGN